MRTKRWTVVMLCASFLMNLFGCGKRHIQDGPGMINPASWDSLTVSRSDSYAQHNFYIKIEACNEGLFVTGELRGDDGTLYIDEEGILLSRKDADRIYALNPALLPDCPPDTTESSDSDFAFALDQSSVEIEVVCTDGRILEKADEGDFSLKVYEIVKSCFAKKHG